MFRLESLRLSFVSAAAAMHYKALLLVFVALSAVFTTHATRSIAKANALDSFFELVDLDRSGTITQKEFSVFTERFQHVRPSARLVRCI
jgi:hypothetical protein